MAQALSGSVGRWEGGAANREADVRTVQTLLAAVAAKLNDPAYDPKGVDGRIARPPLRSNTVAAIEAFQRRFMARPDGVVNANGRTVRELTAAAGPAAAPPAPAGGFYFPFSTMTTWSWSTGARAFASNRSGGRRAHAGCDLYYPKGTWIHAVTGGTVVRGPYDFYASTFALEVDHGGFLARYGEVQRDCPVREGERVTAGQRIAKVGHLVGISVPSDMLHFELYDKTATGPLTVGSAAGKKRADGVPFQRRRDLIDPTGRLDQWRNSLPPG